MSFIDGVGVSAHLGRNRKTLHASRSAESRPRLDVAGNEDIDHGVGGLALVILEQGLRGHRILAFRGISCKSGLLLGGGGGGGKGGGGSPLLNM